MMALYAFALTTTHYDVLSLPKDASMADIKKAYRSAALRHHPDRGGSSAAFEKVNAAFEVLSDEKKRSAYDFQQRQQRAQANGGASRGVLRVPMPCTLRELGGWDPVPLLLVLTQAGLPLRDMVAPA